jgi:hypothetical protein
MVLMMARFVTLISLTFMYLISLISAYNGLLYLSQLCMIANIGPETIEEVYALVPSLKATRSINEGLITEALSALANIKASK